ncbi:MAG: hypothetical protein EBX04_01465 [Rhodobacteraceae bacterium]|nr:hypothetical protein [Paracoccaceae bacterium]NCZ64903.1 hypothetical protein [Paracoccaceae bacterium]NDH72442.1 hypothetical protein [Paracoccaceae bacterium]NDI12599.1 hypothetical protein [Paracoccaceae bacterium]
MEHFSEPEICNWVHQYFNRHKQYITGIKFVLTNVCYSKIIEGTLHMHIERVCYDREFYDGLREAYQLAKYDHLKVPEFLEMWIAETISPAHRPPKYNHKISNTDLFHHVVCQCIHKSAHFTQFPAVKAAACECDSHSIAEIISVELDLAYNDIKNIWLKRDRQWFPN